MRAVFDPNVLISALITPHGAPAWLYRALTRGEFVLVSSPQLLSELGRVLRRERFRRYASLDDVDAYVSALGRLAVVVDDPLPEPGLTADPKDDYLVSLARVTGVDLIVSGDAHLLELEQPRPPVVPPRAFRERLEHSESSS